MSEQNPSSNLPLFQQGVGVPPPQLPPSNTFIAHLAKRGNAEAQAMLDYQYRQAQVGNCDDARHCWSSWSGHPRTPTTGDPCDCGLVLYADFSPLRLTPTQHGQAGAEDAEKHLREEAPGWLLDALGDALLAFQGGPFTSEMVRHKAEQSEAVKGWLAVKGRENCFPGWWRSRVRLHRLVRSSRPPAIARRGSRRGAVLPWWRFPEGR